MSSDLSQNEFPNTAQRGAVSWLFEGFRTRLRDAARFVRMEAAWRTWPAVHGAAKALHEGLRNEADEAAGPRGVDVADDAVTRRGVMDNVAPRGEMMDDVPYIEGTREFGGLLIADMALLYHWLKSRSAS